MDRIARGMEFWNKREDELKNLFRDSNFISKRHFLEEKLKHMESLRDGFRYQVLTSNEKSTMRMLKGQINDLEQRLYPNLVVRLFKKLQRALTQGVTITISPTVSSVQKADPSPRQQRVKHADALPNQQTQNNQLKNNDGTTQPIKKDQTDLGAVTEYKKRLSEKNNVQQPKVIKHRLR
ncbi:hypothetical protein [Longitalea luteola]|uniref:hypothetical protein n=1 Tax=Longitalea luteola TaxID=2812563 RepID=UPI001A971B6E|nr:hypothetical protein [Longitalea luteola]